MTGKSSAWAASDLTWFKSSYSSSGDGNDCVEVAATPGTVHVRDSKNAQAACFSVTAEAWADFVTYASGS
ncbi:DUF397 domain-containing protein [Streptomyces sp. CB01635]|uniref:DUF397 domain-containing protein n=1 Tax=unclassified Streptomyces TaxID=2593676 RepID=UPI000C279F7F|nr:DUF397 domain-containing protein [Streptomyces sp. CB01635]PJN10070.1 DUF397 domain-containing protein [Streptomyces sp. CB01635]